MTINKDDKEIGDKILLTIEKGENKRIEHKKSEAGATKHFKSGEFIFVFDLDDTIVSAVSSCVEDTLKKVEKELGKEFLDKFSFEVLGYTHLVYPGFYSLFRWLYQSGHNIYFFSSAIKERNEDLVHKLIKKTFPENFNKVMNKVKVFSRKDCIDTTIMSSDEREKYQSFHYGQRKKKLAGIVVKENELPDTLLIEDDYSYMTRGEEYNLVKVAYNYNFYPVYRNIREFLSLHKAYYLCGIFAKMFEIVKEKRITLVEAARYLQFDLENETLSRDFYYPSVERIEYYKKGLNILSNIDASLKFYFEPNEENYGV